MKIRFRHFMVLFLTLFFIFSVDSNAASTYRLTAKTICTTRTRVNVRKGPGIRYSVITTLKKGKKVTKVGTLGSWSVVKIQSKKYYIKSSYLKKLYKYIYVAGDGVNLRSGPGTNYRVKAVLPRNTRLKCTARIGNWMKVTYNGSIAYISKPLTSIRKTTTTPGNTVASNNPTADSIRSKAISAATARIGNIYSQSNRNLPGYADCSSLMRDVFLAASGVNIGETTDQQIKRLTPYQKPLSALQPGDILMRIQPGSNHAAIYIGNNYYIHASSTLGKVAQSYYITGSTYWTCCYDAAAYCIANK
ncbi:MAG: SH3 domain-containing protein [Anaerobutyricum sp.]|nr:SH3 domain-containing protein [Anaerobutyricum sp.]